MGGRNFFEEGGTYEPFIQNHVVEAIDELRFLVG